MMDRRNRSNTNSSQTSALSNNIFNNVVASSVTTNPTIPRAQTKIDSDNIDEAFSLRLFENKDFDVDSYVKNIALKSNDSKDLLKTKDKLAKLAEKTAEEIKLSVYNNYTNFMDTAKEVGHLEGKMTQLRMSLDEQKKLIGLFKNLNINNNSSNSLLNETSDHQKQQINQQQKLFALQNNTAKGSLAKLLEEVEGCSVITQKPGREIIFDGDLELLDTTDFSVLNKIHAYLLNDALLLTVPQRKRTKNSNFKTVLINNLDNKHQYKFQALYELHDITVSNIADRKEVRNAFQVYKFPESVVFRCTNSHSKKEWLERIEQTKKTLEISNSHNGRKNENLNQATNKSRTILEEDENGSNLSNTSLSDDFNRSKFIRDQFSDFDIFLAQRDFEKAVDLLIRIKTTSPSTVDSIQQLVYKQKETELITMLRKDLNISKERGNKGIQKTGKRVVNCLVKLKIYDEALNLFIDYHKTLNSESLKKIKLEESNSIYMNNVMNLFFDNLKLSFSSFKEAFQSILNFSLSTYLSWAETEIEILIRKLQSQHYIGRRFDLTIENCELIFDRASQFSKFEVKFFFENKLREIIEKSIHEQKKILMDASIQRAKTFDGNSQVNTHSQNEQNRQTQLQKFLSDLDNRGFVVARVSNGVKTSAAAINGSSSSNMLLTPNTNNTRLMAIRSPSPSMQTAEHNMFDFNLNTLNVSAIQFSRGILNFFCDLLRIYYQDINYTLNEAIVEMFKAELKIYSKKMQEQSSDPLWHKYKKSVENNLNFIFDHLLPLIERLYEEKTKIKSKNLTKLHERYIKYKNENFKSERV